MLLRLKCRAEREKRSGRGKSRGVLPLRQAQGQDDGLKQATAKAK